MKKNHELLRTADGYACADCGAEFEKGFITHVLHVQDDVPGCPGPSPDSVISYRLGHEFGFFDAEAGYHYCKHCGYTVYDEQLASAGVTLGDLSVLRCLARHREPPDLDSFPTNPEP